MIRCILIGLILALMSVIGVNTQESPLRTHLDLPAHGAVVSSEIALQGWVFNCRLDGQQPYSARVYYTGDDRRLYEARIIRRWNGLRRPDVQSAFRGTCGAMNAYTGYRLDVTGIPAGARRLIVIEWADAYGFAYSQREFSVPLEVNR